jgi:hypothetical protein
VREVLRLDRVDPERVLRVDRELRELRVIGVLPDPVRAEPLCVVDPVRVDPVLVAAVLVAAAPAGAAPAMPHTLQ